MISYLFKIAISMFSVIDLTMYSVCMLTEANTAINEAKSTEGGLYPV